MEALARAQARREEAVKAQAAALATERAEIAIANERAKEHGLVAKTAGDSGAAGTLRRKWELWLESVGSPTLQSTATPRSWTRPRPPPPRSKNM